MNSINLFLILCREDHEGVRALKAIFGKLGHTEVILDQPVAESNRETAGFYYADEMLAGFRGLMSNEDYFPRYTAWARAFYHVATREGRFERVWFIEDDVAGDSESFARLVDAVGQVVPDLAATGITSQTEDPSWYWWQHYSEFFDRPYKAFQPLCCMSWDLVQKVLDFRQNRGSFLFHEVLFPSLAFQSGAKVVDWLKDPLMRPCFAVFQYRPACLPNGPGIYHPVKDREEMVSHCASSSGRSTFTTQAASQVGLSGEGVKAEELLVLCANLLRRKDRRFVIEHGLKSVCGQPVEFLAAVDGEAVPEWKLQRYPKGTTAAGYAVRMTKCLALRKFLQSSYSFLLYLEDDIVVCEEFEETVAEGIGRDYEILFLGGNHEVPPDGEGRWRCCVETVDNHALLLNREGARKALAVLRDRRKSWSDREIAAAMGDGRLDCWCVEPWVAFQRQTQSDGWGKGKGVRGVSLAEGARPYLGGDDLAVLDTALNFSKTVVEYGSGGSTVHIAHRLKGWGQLLSVEHQREWHEKITAALKEVDGPVRYLLREPEPMREGDGPWRYLPRQMNRYVAAPREFFGEGEVDLVFVDGRERMRCALEATFFLKKGGLLMIHDFWPRYRYRARLGELLQYYDYLFEAPCRHPMEDGQGMAVFRLRSRLLV